MIFKIFTGLIFFKNFKMKKKKVSTITGKIVFVIEIIKLSIT